MHASQATLLLGPMSVRIASSVAHIAETQRQRGSLKTRSPDRAPTIKKSSRLDRSWHPPRHGQIAIARGTFPTSTPRGFLPWGLSDDGPSACPHARDGPASETLHKGGDLVGGGSGQPCLRKPTIRPSQVRRD